MKKIVAAIAIALCALIAFASLALYGARAAGRLIEERRHNIAGLALAIDGYDVHWLGGTLTLKGIRIYPAGAENDQSLLASAEELVVQIAPLQILRGVLHARSVTLTRPAIAYIVTGKKTSNWDALHLGKDGKTSTPADAEEESLPLVIDRVRIIDGKVAYRNPPRGQRLDLTDVDVSLDHLRAAKKPGELPTPFMMKATITPSGGTIAVKGKGNFLGDATGFELTGSLSSTPIGVFSSFIAGSVPDPIAAGSVAVASRATAKEDRLRSSHHVTITGLRVGGGIKGEVINKYILSQERPISVDVAVNGDLSTGDFSFSAALSKGLADELFKRAIVAAPGIVVDKIRELASPIVLPNAPVQEIIRGLFKGRR